MCYVTTTTAQSNAAPSPISSASEENVWKLCEQVKRTKPNELERCYAVFVSNVGRTVPLWRQKVGRGDDKVVIWVNELN